ncbi:hypothetical protein GFY24_34950 [Nocardia sp. SYP-A9097]|uniref:hypothetical protein n=1 Tax=Nocardia sp. SYP-A9097 TaxID=2663237 RepID=UPI00129BCA7F|nr:hypothetical protein [Nocardia sp. SYP-A9097]MRH92563.1 hypothetical protein [Nocardia sp. SYP-A9097]
MRALLPALRTAVVMTALAGAVAGGSAVAGASAPAGGVPLEVATPAAQPSDAQPIYANTTGSAVLDLLTLFGAPTGSVQKPCAPIYMCPM